MVTSKYGMLKLIYGVVISSYGVVVSIYHVMPQWRSSAPKSGGHKLFSQKLKSKKKKKKNGHSGVKAHDRVLWDS